ncbi:MAG: hypothetical protein WCI34_08080 [Actinomycetes bacterium]
MRKFITAALTLTVGSLVVANAASATIVQRNDIKMSPVSGTVLKNSAYFRVQAYLASRDADSTRGTKKANPVGKVAMVFPPGVTVNKTAKPTCNLSEYASVPELASRCSASVVGTGWAILNTGSAVAREQLTGVAPGCSPSDPTQYSREWNTNPVAGPDCIPLGYIVTKLTAYQGGVLKAQWWCYGDAGAPSPGAPCTNKLTTGDFKNTLFVTGPTNGTFNDVTNKKGMNGCNLILANDNGAAPIAFGATISGCGNRLSAVIPALNGTGSGLGEVTGGFVLSDLNLNITATNYLKAGSKSCSAHKMTVTTTEIYSRFKGEATDPNPASNTNSYNNAC